MTKRIDDGFGYAGHWNNGKLYVSLRAESARGLAIGRGERFDDADQAARWLLVDVGVETAPKAREALGQLSQTVKQESWVLRAVDVVGWANSPRLKRALGHKIGETQRGIHPLGLGLPPICARPHV